MVENQARVNLHQAAKLWKSLLNVYTGKRGAQRPIVRICSLFSRAFFYLVFPELYLGAQS